MLLKLGLVFWIARGSILVVVMLETFFFFLQGFSLWNIMHNQSNR